MTKEKFNKEVDIAFQIHEILKQSDYESNHRIMSIVEQLRREEQKLSDIAAKEAYATGRPVAVK